MRRCIDDGCGVTPERYSAWALEARARLVQRTRSCAVPNAEAEEITDRVLTTWLLACHTLTDETDADAVCRRSVVTRALNWHRDTRRRRDYEPDIAALSPDPETPSDVAERAITQSAVRHALEQLTPRQAWLVWAIYVDEQSIDELLHAATCSRRTLYRELNAAKRVLRKALVHYAPHGSTPPRSLAPPSDSDKTSRVKSSTGFPPTH
jgi:DNA-directed RNA polymerase specialized sigma24 family protein